MTFSYNVVGEYTVMKYELCLWSISGKHVIVWVSTLPGSVQYTTSTHQTEQSGEKLEENLEKKGQ